MLVGSVVSIFVYWHFLPDCESFAFIIFGFCELLFILNVPLVKGAYISHQMKLVDTAGASRGGRGRVWQCKLCKVEGSEANVALHIHEAHT